MPRGLSNGDTSVLDALLQTSPASLMYSWASPELVSSTSARACARWLMPGVRDCGTRRLFAKADRVWHCDLVQAPLFSLGGRRPG
jgi:hypothetical protein